MWKLNVSDNGLLKKKIPNCSKIKRFQTRNFENWICKALRKVFGPKWSGKTEKWRKLCSEKVYNFYFTPNFIWAMKSKKKGQVCERKCACRILAGKRPLKKPRLGWENSMKMNLKLSWGLDSNDLSQNRDVGWTVLNVVVNLTLSQKCGEFLNT